MQFGRTSAISRGCVLALLAACTGGTTGCAFKTTPPPDAVSHAPLVVDAAMQQRQWPISVAQFSNGSTPAWPTGALLTHRANSPAWQEVASDTPIFLGNVLLFPLDYAITPPWLEVVYPLGEIEASYHAMPPLPPK